MIPPTYNIGEDFMRKTISLLLAIVMLMSVLIIPAAAAMPAENAVEPCGGFADCPGCGSSSPYTTSSTNTETKMTTCTNSGTSHLHSRTYYYRIFNCSYCNYGAQKIYTSSWVCSKAN